MILAVDPGLATCGYAVVTPGTGRVLELGTLLSEPDPDVDDSTDRARRAWVQGHALGIVARRHGCSVVAAEAMSFGGPPKARFAMAVSLGLSWGVLASLAVAIGAELLEVPPKKWQRAVDPNCGKKVDYKVVFAKLSDFISGDPRAQLYAIAERHRNHAIDAVAIGLYAALRDDMTRIANGAAA